MSTISGIDPPRLARLVATVLAAAAAYGCAAAARPSPPPSAPSAGYVTLDQKVSWMLRLEQQRVFRDPGLVAAVLPGASADPVDPAVPAAPPMTVVRFTPATTADLGALIQDPDAAVRRRAALAIGRAHVDEGQAWLAWAVHDPEEDVRAASAFALGLLGSLDAVEALLPALLDPSPLVTGRAMEALGLLGRAAASAAPAVADASSGCALQLAPLDPDDEEYPKSPEIEACRQALFALVKLGDYDSLARVVLDEAGRPVSRWWPVAYALQRIGDERALPALRALSSSTGIYTPAFALRGLAAARDEAIRPLALALAGRSDSNLGLRVTAVRALGQIGGGEAVEPLVNLVFDPATPPNLAIEGVGALATIRDPRVFADLVDLFSDPWPAMRSAAMAAAARVDPDGFVLVLSSLRPDPDPSVRAGLAAVLATLDAELVRPALMALAEEQDVRVVGPALRALAAIETPDLPERLFSALSAPDYVVRAAAARLVGQAHLEGGAEHLVAAYERGESDSAADARAAALDALVQYGAANAVPTLRRALADREWPVRLQAAASLRELGESADPERPAPLRHPAEFFESDVLLRPAFSPHAFIETRHGTIEIELNVVEAPLTSLSFIDLVRSGFFNGLKVHRLVPHFVIQIGDPRGDGAGGPGYTIRDELAPLPYHRGTVGMALAGPETGGSQFFITLSPQPHLNDTYTVFGQVVQGDEVLDRIQQGDVIERVRIWDGVTFRE